MNTNELIDALVRDTRPVRPLARVETRTLRWLVVWLPVLALALVWMGARPDLGAVAGDPGWLAAQTLSLATGIAAAVAALALTVPGRSRWPLGIALGMMGLWMMALGSGCAADLRLFGSAALEVSPEPECFVLIVAFCIAPALVLVAMARRGVPLAPSHTLCCCTIASGALGAFVLGLVHAQPLSLMVLVWQWGSVLVLGGIGWALGPALSRLQRHATGARG